MAKAGEKYTSPDGKTWVATEGGNWREYVNGKATGNVSKGSTPPGGAAAPGATPAATDAGASQQTTVNNTPPSNLSPQGSQWLNLAWQNLQQQVAQGLLTPAQAQAQGEQNNKLIASESPAMQAKRLDMQGQVQAGLMNYSDLENQMYQNKQNESQTAPTTGTNLTADSTTSQVANEISDQAKGSTMAGNLLTNPNQVGPFGSSTTTIDPVTGQPTVTQNLSQANQNVLGGIQGMSQGATGVGQGLINNQYGQFVQGAGPQSGYADPELEKAIYGRLTQGFAEDDKVEREDFEQRLANRGIGVGSGDAYNNAMRQYQTAKDTKYENARNNATIQGTQTAVQRQANNVGALGALTGGVGTLGQVGQAGFYQPNFQAFNSVAYNQPDVQGLYGTQVGTALTREQIQAEKDMQAKQLAAQKSLMAGAGGGGHEESSSPPPFNVRPPGS